MALTNKEKMQIIRSVVCNYYTIPEFRLSMRTRKRAIVEPRQIFIYLSKKNTDATLDAIAAEVKKDHATVLHSITVVCDLIVTDKDFAAKISEIEIRVKTKLNNEKSNEKDNDFLMPVWFCD